MSQAIRKLYDQAFDDPALAGTIIGTPGNDSLEGTQSADTIQGNGGNDVLGGKAGDDYLAGGGGNDVAYGGQGADQILGGDGNDTIFGGGGDDMLRGEGGGNIIFGGAGSDNILAVFGDDTMFGGAGDDSFTIFPASNVHAYGDDGNDTFDIFANFALSGGLPPIGSIGIYDGGADDGTFKGDTLQVLTGPVGGAAGYFFVNFSNADEGGPLVMQNIERVDLLHIDNSFIEGLFFIDAHDVHAASSSTDKLLIDGDATWTVEFENNAANPFVASGTATFGSQVYNVYADGTAELLVDSDVNFTIV